jgi:hypothetical protein
MADAQTELARQTFEGVQALRTTLGSVEGKMSTVSKLISEDHDSITAMKGALESIQISGRETATASLRVADLAEEKAKREAARDTATAKAAELRIIADRESATRRFKFLEDNWQKVALVLLILGGFNVQPILAYLGGGAVAVQASPPAVVAPLIVAPPNESAP